MLEICISRLYSANELQDLLSKRTIERLRGHGLVALAGLYLGQNVLDAWVKAADAEWQCRRGLKKGEVNEETTQQAKRVEENHARRVVQPISKPKPGVSLADQLERSRRQTASGKTVG